MLFRSVSQSRYNFNISSLETSSTIVKVISLFHKLEEPDYIKVYDIIASQEDKDRAALETYKEYSGCRYGYESYIWFIYRWIMRKFGKEPNKIWKFVSNGVTCTELTCYYLSKINSQFATLFEGKDINTYSPEELQQLINQNSELFEFKGWLIPLKEVA